MSNLNNKHVFTKEGYDKLQKELEHLKTVVRKEIAEKLSVAVSYGDLSENAAYTAAIEARDFNEARIAELEEILQNAEIVDSNFKKGVIGLGSKVKIQNVYDDSYLEFTVVGAGEVDLLNKKYSADSPLVASLIGKKVGEIVELDLPNGKFKYKIISCE